ncbi:hypothetical protein ElyMa_005639200 [Elysia marginata]|uniref:SMB domain-containing protein n=1 Tax=Elysia marginata TaxID=1093978 RepID=A0AAV4F933_9GAST|nr:hypothetical protein ElyMa_005639200 [Elysia marginata]
MNVHQTVDDQRLTQNLTIGMYRSNWEATTEMAAMIFEQGLCSRDDIVRRISCTGRCGEQSDTRANPGQCSCDSDCFRFGDCCEDMNMLCPSDFVDAVKMYKVEFNEGSLQDCTIRSKYLPSDFLTLKHRQNFDEPQSFELYCDLEGFQGTALKDITSALINGKCVSSAFARNYRLSSRSCDRPDVLLCETDMEINFYSAFPVHLKCFNHQLSYSLLRRFGVLGMNGMETISKDGRCRLLRLPSTGRNSDDLDKNSQVWTSKLDVLKLVVSRSLNMTFFDFQSDHFGTIRCVGRVIATDLKCAMFDCPSRHLLDIRSQTCYRPGHVNFQFLGQKTKTPETGDKTDITQGESDGLNATSPPVSVCLCLKTHSVMTNLGWWQVISDTSSMLDGRCELTILGYQTDRNLAANEEKDELLAEEMVTVRADDLGENSPDRASEYTVVEEDGLFVSYYFSELVLNIWRNKMQRCSSKEHSLVARWCFSGWKSLKYYETCFSWRKRTTNEEKISTQCPISSSSASSPFGVYRRSWYEQCRLIYAFHIIAVLIKITHTIISESDVWLYVFPQTGDKS